MRARSVVGLVCLVVLLLGGTAAPRDASAADCPAQPLTVAELTGLQGDDEWLEFMGFVNHAGRRCYGRSDVRIIGYADAPPAMGWERPWSLVPNWFSAPGLILYGDAQSRPDGDPPGTFYNLAWPGEYGELMERYEHRWVVVTAHFRDRRAEQCRFDGPEPQTPSDASAVRGCRSILVITRVRLASAPDTATASPPAADAAMAPDLERVLLPIAALVGVLAWVGRRRLVR